MINKSTFNNIKPVFSGHETFPLRYGWLKKVFDAACEAENSGKSITKDLFNNDEAIAILGVGKNMVTSMRHWATWCKVLDREDATTLKTNSYFAKIFSDSGLDPWMENYATLWLIHWQLATTGNLFTYYWFFNYWNASNFDKDSLTLSIVETMKDHNLGEVSLQTLKRDVECFIRVYSSKTSKDKSNEESIESPLTELGLIEPLTRRDLFQKKRGVKPSLSLNTFLFGLLMFWKEYSPNSKTLSLEAMCYEPLSPGRIFLVDENAVGEFIQDLAYNTGGMLEWSETAGLKQIILKKDIDFDKEAYGFLERNYK